MDPKLMLIHDSLNLHEFERAYNYRRCNCGRTQMMLSYFDDYWRDCTVFGEECVSLDNFKCAVSNSGPKLNTQIPNKVITPINI